MDKPRDSDAPRDVPSDKDEIPLDQNASPIATLRPAGVEFIRFFTLAGFGGLFLVGYSYVNQLYEHFALALHEVNIGYLETFEYVAYLFGEGNVALIAIATAVLSSLIVGGARILLEDLWFYPLVLALFVLLAFFAAKGGAYMANSYAIKLIQGDLGRPAYCVIKRKADIPLEVKKSFDDVTSLGLVRMLHQTEKMVYLFVVPADSGEAYVFGEHLAFQRDDLSHCRVFSAFRSNAS